MFSTFTPSHRAGSGPPLLLLHGFTDTWRTWELVLPSLERRHDVLALTLAGHAGGPVIEGEIADALLADAVERAMDEAGLQTAQELLKSAAPHAEAILASGEGRRRATQDIATSFEHIPVELLAHQMRGAASCRAVFALIDHAAREGWRLEPEKITCPVRIVWGTGDNILSWPSAAARYRHDWLPHADWIELDGVGHCPQLDVPLETAQLILGWTAG